MSKVSGVEWASLNRSVKMSPEKGTFGEDLKEVREQAMGISE